MKRKLAPLTDGHCLKSGLPRTTALFTALLLCFFMTSAGCGEVGDAEEALPIDETSQASRPADPLPEGLRRALAQARLGEELEERYELVPEALESTALAQVLSSDKVTASDGFGNDLFGYSVSISGTTALVGSPYDDDRGSSSGSAYIFYRSGRR